jgi:hypothetical protein
MKQTTSIVLLILTVLGEAASATQKSNSQNKEKVNVYRKYDKKKGETVTQTDLMLIYGPDPGPYSLGFGLSMFAAYTFPGQKASTPETITLNFISSENRYVFSFEHDLTIKADNEILNLGKMEYEQTRGTSAVAHEKLWQALPRDVFARIAYAKTVHVKLGQKEFDLTDHHLKNLQALLSSIGR